MCFALHLRFSSPGFGAIEAPISWGWLLLYKCSLSLPGSRTKAGEPAPRSGILQHLHSTSLFFCFSTFSVLNVLHL